MFWSRKVVPCETSNHNYVQMHGVGTEGQLVHFCTKCAAWVSIRNEDLKLAAEFASKELARAWAKRDKERTTVE